MKIGKVFLIASGMVVGLGVAGNGAEASFLGGLASSGESLLHSKSCSKCHSKTAVGVCFLSDHSFASGTLPSQMSPQEQGCLDTYCKTKTNQSSKACEAYNKTSSQKGGGSKTHKKKKKNKASW